MTIRHNKSTRFAVYFAAILTVFQVSAASHTGSDDVAFVDQSTDKLMMIAGQAMPATSQAFPLAPPVFAACLIAVFVLSGRKSKRSLDIQRS